jgi:two-component system, OmpR family, sensor histidine kinase KdpD
LRLFNTRKYPLHLQYTISIICVLSVSIACFYSAAFIGYRVVALILLVTTSLIAMLFDILPVMIAAILSAIIWNFLFIPPLFTFHITNAEDLLMFLLYFVVAMVNAVLTFKIRDAEKKARDKEEKEHTIQLYNTLLNSLSHELRTPIATILGAVDTLKENKEKLSNENQVVLLTEIDAASMRLNRQVENLLNMSRLESGMLKLKLDWCDANALIYDVLHKFILVNDHPIQFNPSEGLPLFKLDEGIIEQVVYNLIHNAILYTPAHTIIEITTLYQENNFVLIITDHGNGFNEHETALVFNKFYRSPQSKTGGSGLGLSIVKGFIESHGGTINLVNSNHGATFQIKIPSEVSFLSNLKHE